MALPHRRQQLAKFIPFHDWTTRTLTAEMNRRLPEGHERLTEGNLILIAHGRRYPSPDEIDSLEAVFSTPIEVLLDASMLRFRDRAKWPPYRRGYERGSK